MSNCRVLVGGGGGGVVVGSIYRTRKTNFNDSNKINMECI